MCTDPRHFKLFGVRFELFEQVVYVCFDRRTTALTGSPVMRGSYMLGPISLTRALHDISSDGINFQFYFFILIFHLHSIF